MRDSKIINSLRIRRSIVVAGILLSFGILCPCSLSASPFSGQAEVKVDDSDVSNTALAPSISLKELIARKDAIPNLPWNWKKRDQVLLDGAGMIDSTTDIIALTRETGFEGVRDKILLIGLNTPKNLEDIQALFQAAIKKETKDNILLANIDKLKWEEIISVANMASAEIKDQIFREALSKAYSQNPVDEPQGTLWLTDPGRLCYLQKQADKPRFGQLTVNGPTISIDETSTFQSMDGFGFALTGGSAHLINSIPEEDRNKLLRKLFLPDAQGIGASFLRVSIGASDLSEESFSYDDLPSGVTDTELREFDISAGDKDFIPLMKEILAINPSIRIIATPWSAPPWMKTNRSFIGGKLDPKYYSCYADYFVKYIQTMHENGIRIHAISPQNEPFSEKNEPSMVMEAHEQATFIRDHLGPALQKAGLNDVELFCWDHNCDKKEYPLSVLSDPGARKYIAGVAWHLYAGEIGALSEVRQAFPKMKMYLTEQWTGRKGTFAGDFRWHVKTVLIGSVRNWSQAVLEWNLASDPSCDPHTPKGCPDCKGAITVIPGTTPQQPFNVSYYIIGHAAKFVRPGSVRIFTSPVDQLPNVAFLTTDGKMVLIVLNDSNEPMVFNIQWRGKTAVAYLNQGSAGTYIWQQ